MPYKEEQIKLFISRYRQSVFALVLYLIGGDQDKVYDICAASFAEAVHRGSPLEQDEVFLNRLVSIVVEKSRNIETIPTFAELGLLDLSAAEKEPLPIVLKAFHMLDFDAKVVILLRDQLNLLYEDMGTIMQTSETEVRRKTAQARGLIREKIEDIINHE